MGREGGVRCGAGTEHGWGGAILLPLNRYPLGVRTKTRGRTPGALRRGGAVRRPHTPIPAPTQQNTAEWAVVRTLDRGIGGGGVGRSCGGKGGSKPQLGRPRLCKRKQEQRGRVGLWRRVGGRPCTPAGRRWRSRPRSLVCGRGQGGVGGEEDGTLVGSGTQESKGEEEDTDLTNPASLF